ncbi:MAG: S9 family peptidase [Calditrichia bacterium]
MNRPFLPVILMFCLFLNLSAQISTDSTFLTLDRIFSGEFRGERGKVFQWLGDKDFFTSMEPSDSVDGGFDLVKTSLPDLEKEIMIPADRFIPPGESSPLTIEKYHWSDSYGKLLIFTNSKRVWRYNTRGDYWVYDLESDTLYQLGKNFPPSSMMFAKISPDEQYAAYVVQSNIYMENLRTGEVDTLTRDGNKDIINGTTDWVYEEEFGLRDGFSWSPDSRRILFFHFDTRSVPVFHMINNTDSLYPKIISFQYPKAGDTNSAVTLRVVDVRSKEMKELNIPGDPRNNYIPRAEWASEKDVILQRMNRLQNENKLMIYDVDTDKFKVLFVDKDAAWVDYNRSFIWTKNKKDVLFLSDRDGWRHIYKISMKGKITLLTAGEFDVVSIEGVNKDKKTVYFTASPGNAAQRYLYRTSIKGNKKIKRITPAQFTGTNSYAISPNGKWAVHRFSTYETPWKSALIGLNKHSVLEQLTTNEKLEAKLKVLKKAKVEFTKITIHDSVQLDAWIMKPYNFNPGTKYPVFFYVYGEPAGQTVLDAYRGSQYLWHLYLTQQGYIVMSVDNRGTPAPKGRDWRKIAYRKIGCLTSADQAEAARVVRKWDFVDSTRIGIWGWSGGGSMTLNCLFRYPDIYKMGIAVAAVSDFHYYDTIYEERYMGLPGGENDPYISCSAISKAHQLKGDLLIIHGTGDDNVHYQNAEAVINKLIEHNKPFWMLSYPNRSHGIYEGRNTRRHLFMMMTNFLFEKMPSNN